MAVTQLYTAVANDVITAARWNNEFGNIYNNGTAIAFPLTIAASLAGFTLTLDAAGVTTLTSTAAVGLTLTQGVKTGTPGVGANNGQTLNIISSTFTDNNTAGSGTAAEYSAVSILTPTLAATNTSVTTTDAATVYIQAAPTAGTNETITNAWAIWVDGGAVRFDGALRVDGAITSIAAISTTSSLIVGSLLAGKPIGGLTYTRDAGDTSNDILVAVGEAVSDDATLASRRLMVLATAIIGQIDTGTWVVGTSQPKLDTGTVANVPYYIWLIQRADTGVVDILFSASGTAPTMPTNYAFKRLIGWFSRLGAVNSPFTTYELEGGGLEFYYTTPVADVAIASLTTSRTTSTLSVPAAFSVLAHLRLLADDAAALNIIVTCPDETDAAPSITTAPGVTFRSSVAAVPTVAEGQFRTSSTGTIASRALANTIDAYDIITVGFEMSRR